MIIAGMSALPDTTPVSDALQPAASAPQGAVRLTDWGLIRAVGPDAAGFLHGQLTADITGLPAGRAALAGYCSAKGRLLASFIVWSPAPEEWLLACSADVLPSVLKRLSMFVLRAKCKLSDASADWPLWGLAGDGAAAWLGAEASTGEWAVQAGADRQVLRLPGAAPRWLVALPATAPAPALPTLSAADWRALEVRSGVVRIVAATADQFVPQMVNFELVGGVNFKKGCYPGQEVVARSQYRGTLKRRAWLMSAPTALVEGQEVFHDTDPGQPAGLVALAAPQPGGAVALVELKRALVDAAGAFHLGAADGPVMRVEPLPYPLPADNE